jgi:hypothetical protein
MLVALFAVALIAIVGGGFGLYTAMTPAATAAAASPATQQGATTRWFDLTAGQLFPRTVIYTSTGVKADWSAQLVGIAPKASCAAATDPQIGPSLARSGCRALLRATYADASGTLLATVGIAAMPSAAVAEQTFQVIHDGQQAGVRTVSFPGTISSQFGDGQRTQIQTEYQGPYIFFIAVGYADGRLTHATDDDSAVQDMAYGILDALTGILNQAGNPCHDKDVRC